MEPRKPGSTEMPDFKDMTDRVTADQPSEPMLVIKTNLDPKDITDENPYANQKKAPDQTFKNFFE